MEHGQNLDRQRQASIYVYEFVIKLKNDFHQPRDPTPCAPNATPLKCCPINYFEKSNKFHFMSIILNAAFALLPPSPPPLKVAPPQLIERRLGKATPSGCLQVVLYRRFPFRGSNWHRRRRTKNGIARHLCVFSDEINNAGARARSMFGGPWALENGVDDLAFFHRSVKFNVIEFANHREMSHASLEWSLKLHDLNLSCKFR